jgi:hypothetical protein
LKKKSLKKMEGEKKNQIISGFFSWEFSAV